MRPKEGMAVDGMYKSTQACNNDFSPSFVFPFVPATVALDDALPVTEAASLPKGVWGSSRKGM
jgi:hypothetical protein